MIEILGMIPLTAAALTACWYSHAQLPSVARSQRQLLLARLILLLVGLGFALVMVRSIGLAYAGGGWLLDVLVFVSAFGAVHVPAAFIIFIKRVRRSQGV